LIERDRASALLSFEMIKYTDPDNDPTSSSTTTIPTTSSSSKLSWTQHLDCILALWIVCLGMQNPTPGDIYGKNGGEHNCNSNKLYYDWNLKLLTYNHAHNKDDNDDDDGENVSRSNNEKGKSSFLKRLEVKVMLKDMVKFYSCK
jgi:hypothetical protein